MLIPLYAVGVFMSFTLSQTGMVRHWLKEAHSAPHHVVLNGLGALATGIVTIVIAVSKFTHGAWVVVVLIPLIVAGLLRIERHYQRVVERLTLAGASRPKIGKNPVVLFENEWSANYFSETNKLVPLSALPVQTARE